MALFLNPPLFPLAPRHLLFPWQRPSTERSMVHITEELVRRRAEHNECEIFSLEEVSLHQQDIEKLEHLDHWCRELRILYLQNNLIPKIENVGRLKKLEYLNLALNNIEVIENLEGCESLQKLDLTVNFVGRLSSVESLKHNIHLRELFLVGNPCSEFEGYRQYVVAALPQLKCLDGTEISRSERIRAAQGLEQVRVRVHQEEQEYLQKRQREREGAQRKDTSSQERKLGFDECRADIQEKQSQKSPDLNKEDQAEVDFWQMPCSFNPESRLEAYRHLEEKRRAQKKDKEKKPKPPRTMINADGRVLNANEPKLDFNLTEDEENNTIVLELAVYRHLETSLIEVDVQPNFARVIVKGKVFQMVLPAEVKPDSSSAQRSQTTGHLLLTMPKAEGEIKVRKKTAPVPCSKRSSEDKTRSGTAHEKLEVDPSKHIDLTNIVRNVGESKGPLEMTRKRADQSESSVSEGFVDDPDVPPLI